SSHDNNRELVDQVTEPSGRIDVAGYNALGEMVDFWTNTGAAVSFTGNTVNPPSSFATHRHAVSNTSGGVTSLVNTLASSDSNLFSSVAFGYETSTGCAGTPANANTDQIRFEYDSVTSLLSSFCYDGAGRLSSPASRAPTTPTPMTRTATLPVAPSGPSRTTPRTRSPTRASPLMPMGT
ncbi:MAG: hypothetical protein ACRDYC_04335, partial [Acidimicrobiales bacterium]